MLFSEGSRITRITTLATLMAHCAWAGFDASVDGFEVAGGYNPMPNQTVVGRPAPGTDGIWNGPWQAVLGADPAIFVSTDERALSGTRSLRIDAPSDGTTREISRVLDPGLNIGANPIHRVETWIYVPSSSIFFDAGRTEFEAYMGGSPSGKPAAGIRNGYTHLHGNNPPGNQNVWYVWDSTYYRETQIPVKTNTWVRLTMELDTTHNRYKAFIDGVQAIDEANPANIFNFGSGNGTNLTSISLTASTAAGSPTNFGVFYFDSMSITPNVPEVSSWLGVIGMIGAGGLPMWLARRRRARR